MGLASASIDTFLKVSILFKRKGMLAARCIIIASTLPAIAIAVLSIHISYGTLSSALMLFLPYCTFDVAALRLSLLPASA